MGYIRIRCSNGYMLAKPSFKFIRAGWNHTYIFFPWRGRQRSIVIQWPFARSLIKASNGNRQRFKFTLN